VAFDHVQDLLAFRILVSNITECYKTLGVIHSYYTPIPGRFKDYVAIPKLNNYQSLHTTVIGPKAERIEIQIRTHEMHEVAEKGIAAHWKYKERGSGIVDPSALTWVKDLLEFNSSVGNSSEFMDAVKEDLDMGGVFVFTPNGDVKELRQGATPLDFAYAVHTEVGHRCVGAKVNGKIVSLKFRLKSGDTIDILTSKNQTPSKDWLKICKTGRAKTKIRQYLTKIERDRSRDQGELLLDRALQPYGTNSKALDKRGELKKVYETYNAKHLEELYIHIGSSRCSTKEVLPLIASLKISAEAKEKTSDYSASIEKAAKKTAARDNAVIVDGLDDVQVRMGKCCSPIPGDNILGFVTKGRGITIHAIDCSRMQEIELGRRVDVSWNSHYAFKHPVSIRVVTNDRPGVLALVSKQINNAGINIRSAMAKSLPDQRGGLLFEIEVKDYSELLKVVSSIKSLEEVIIVERANQITPTALT
jgi:GTP pyrophosphokinase